MAYINGKPVLFSAEITGLVNIDNEMSDTSENPVQNKVVKQELDKKPITNGTGSKSAIIGSSTNEASGNYSVAMGTHNKASGVGQVVAGTYNKEDTENKYAEIVGGGTSDNNRKNIRTLDKQGNGYFAGTVKASTPVENNDLATKEYVDDKSTEKTPVKLGTITPTEAVASISFDIPNAATEKWKKVWIWGTIKSNDTTSANQRFVLGTIGGSSLTSVSGSFFKGATYISAFLEVMPNQVFLSEITGCQYNYVAGTTGKGTGRFMGASVTYIKNFTLKFDTPAGTMIDVGTNLEIWGLA